MRVVLCDDLMTEDGKSINHRLAKMLEDRGHVVEELVGRDAEGRKKLDADETAKELRQLCLNFRPEAVVLDLNWHGSFSYSEKLVKALASLPERPETIVVHSHFASPSETSYVDGMKDRYTEFKWMVVQKGVGRFSGVIDALED